MLEFLPPLPSPVQLVRLSLATARDSDNRCSSAPSRPRRIAMRIIIPRSARLSVGAGLVAVGLVGAVRAVAPAGNALSAGVLWGFDKVIEDNANLMVREGRETFRFDTFGDEAFWGDALQLHRAIAGSPNGGIGPGVSPKTALAVGLKVDVDALPETLRQQLREGKVNLDDPATTLALLKLNAVVGVTGFFNANGNIQSMGIQCAFCHSTVNNSLAPGIGQRLDGWANRDLNVGAIASLAPNLKPFSDLLGVNVETVKKVFASWGPGRFDAELDKDGKACRAALLSAGDPRAEAARGVVRPSSLRARARPVQRQGPLRDVSRPTPLHGAREQLARTERDRRRRVPSGPLAHAHVPHRAAGGAMDTSEGRVLSRRPLRDAARCGGPLRHVFQAGPH